jgi:4a-hydroxytetrahydrobiopterin dehydratase
MKVMKLLEKKCIPCEGGIDKLNYDEIISYNKQLNNSWQIIDDMKITKEFNFDNYMENIDFVMQVAQLAEDESHHPVMHVFFSKTEIELWTHAILGLSENDFILAAKIDDLY